jgi:hypothetical protein
MVPKAGPIIIQAKVKEPIHVMSCEQAVICCDKIIKEFQGERVVVPRNGY